jgi:ABC-type branched-subunit amino acid transport system ATPase component
MPAKETRYSVYFSNSDDAPPKTPAIVRVPTTDAWNDFGYRSVFTAFRIEKGSGAWEPLDLHVGFTDSDESPVERVKGLLKDERHVSAFDVGEYFTLGSGMEYYRTLVRRLSPTGARGFLAALNDLVEVRRRKEKPSWLARAVETQVFKKSFMRNGERFFAYHNAGPILSGLRREVLGGLSKRLKLSFQLNTFSNPHDVDIEFAPDSIMPGRIVVLIGKNGTGKSRTLHTLVSCALQDDPRLTDGAGARPRLNRLIAIESPGETHETFPEEDPDAKIDYRRISLHRSARASGRTDLASLFVQLAHSDESIKDVKRWAIFAKAVAAMLPLHEIVVRVRAHSMVGNDGMRVSTGPRWASLSELTQGFEEKRLELWLRVDPRREPRRIVAGDAVPLSSGQIVFLRFAAQACLHIENGTLALLDEPETHLHPNLITEFVGLLNRLLELTGSFAIIATHSSYFVREVARRQALVFTEVANEDEEGAGIAITNPRLRTLGADVGAISFFVFGDDLQSKLLDRVRERLADAKKRRRLLPRLREELPAEAIMHLRREWRKRK